MSAAIVAVFEASTATAPLATMSVVKSELVSLTRASTLDFTKLLDKEKPKANALDSPIMADTAEVASLPSKARIVEVLSADTVTSVAPVAIMESRI